MVINIFATLVWMLAYHLPVHQSNDVILTLKLSGTAIDEGHNKPVTYFTFYEFDRKCRIRGAGKVKLNKEQDRPPGPARQANRYTCHFTMPICAPVTGEVPMNTWSFIRSVEKTMILK